MDILCVDKTGTLTQNKLTLGDPFSVDKVPAEQVILCAALASRAEDKDTIDLAVLGGIKDDKDLKAARYFISCRSTRCISVPKPRSKARMENSSK